MQKVCVCVGGGGLPRLPQLHKALGLPSTDVTLPGSYRKSHSSRYLILSCIGCELDPVSKTTQISHKTHDDEAWWPFARAESLTPAQLSGCQSVSTLPSPGVSTLRKEISSGGMVTPVSLNDALRYFS